MARRDQRRIKTKKAPAASPAGHDYRQPKLEEGIDAFWRSHFKTEMVSIAAVCSA
jgi:hypothetical protein